MHFRLAYALRYRCGNLAPPSLSGGFYWLLIDVLRRNETSGALLIIVVAFALHVTRAIITRLI